MKRDKSKHRFECSTLILETLVRKLVKVFVPYPFDIFILQNFNNFIIKCSIIHACVNKKLKLISFQYREYKIFLLKSLFPYGNKLIAFCFNI